MVLLELMLGVAEGLWGRGVNTGGKEGGEHRGGCEGSSNAGLGWGEMASGAHG